MGGIPLCMLYTLMMVSIGLPKTDAATTTTAPSTTSSTTSTTTALPDCTMPDVANGTVTGNITAGSTVTVSCQPGFSRNGADTLTCNPDGTWDTDIPTCDIVSCADLDIGHGGYTGATTYGSTVTVTCDTGYTVNGVDSLACGADGSWSDTVPSCDAIACADLDIGHGGYTGATTYGSTVTVTCDTGYTVNGVDSLACGADGSWSDTVPSCDAIACADLDIGHGGYTGATTYGSTVTVTCDTGYTVNGVDSLACGADGSWSDTVPSCDAIACADLDIGHGGYTGATTYGSTVTVTCDTGYTVNGVDSLACGADGSWSDTVPSCDAIGLGDRCQTNDDCSAIANSVCDDASGSLSCVCEPGHTDNGAGVCQVDDCGSIAVPNANVTGNTTYGSTLTVACETGYQINGMASLTCLAGGSWNDVVPSCDIVNCTMPDVANGTVTGNITAGSTVTVSCEPGFSRNGADTLTCNADGTWDTDIPTCDIVSCADLVDIGHGGYTGATTYGSTVTVTCDTGYTVNGVDSLACGADGSWSDTVPSCDAIGLGDRCQTNDDCSAIANSVCDDASGSLSCVCEPGHTDNGAGVCQVDDCGSIAVPNANVTGNTTYGSTLTVACETGYQIDGIASLTCPAGGSWNDMVPSCDIVKHDYGVTCLEKGPAGQCKTHNSSCLDNGTGYKCLCSEGDFHNEPSDNACIHKIQLKAEVTGQSTDHVILNITRGNMPTECFVVYEVNGTQPAACSVNVTVEGPSLSYTYPLDENLAAGTCYKLVVKSMYSGSVNEFPENVVNACTKPTAMELESVPPESRLATEVPIKFKWRGIRTSALHFLAVDSNKTTFQITSLQKRGETEEKKWDATIVGLTPATKYDVYVHAVQNNIAGDSIHITLFWTKPSPPQNCSLVEPERETTSLTIDWEPGTGTREYFKIKNVAGDGHVTGTQYKVEDLNPGHHYCYDICTFGGNDEFSEQCRVCAYTKPAIPVSLRFLNITATTFSVTWQPGTWQPGDESSDDYYHVTLQELTDGNVTRSANTTAATVLYRDLAAATEYTVTVRAVRNVTENGSPVTLYSGNISREHYTRPESPTSMNISHIHETNFTVNWITVDNSTFTHVYIEVLSDRNNYSHTINNTSYPVVDLISGIRYRVYVYTVYADMKSEPKTMEVYTVPSPPSKVSVPVETITSESLTVSWTDDDPRFLSWTVAVMSSTTDVIQDIPANTTSMQVTGLTSGTSYTLAVYTSVPGQTSQHALISSYTRPSPPVNGTISLHYEANFTLTWAGNDERFDHYRVTVGEPHPAEYNFTVGNTDTSHVIGGLSAATNYTVSLYTEINGLQCLEPIVVSSYTSPLKPNAAVLTDIGEHSVQINLTNDGAEFDHYCVIYDQDDPHNKTVPSTESSVHIDSLTAGTEYTFTVYTLLYGILSEHQNVVTSYTRPLKVSNITLVAVTSSSMEVSWTAPGEGGADSYNVVFNCTSPNKDPHHFVDIVHVVSELNATAHGLHPGSFCTVKVNAIAGNESGGEEIKHIKTSTTEMAPKQVASLSAIMDNSSAVSVSWGRPDVRNGLIRRYDLLVAYTNGSCVRKIVYNCTDCQELSPAGCQQGPSVPTTETGSCTGPQMYRTFSPKQNELQEDVGGLQPYTNYTFDVQAFTRCYGPDTSTTTQTDEAKPSSPRKVTMSDRSHNSITVKWDPPLHPNGVITNYSVTYKYHDPVCHGQGVPKQKDVYPNMGLLNLHSPQLTIEGLHPFWDYNITVKAATIKGFGPASLAVTDRTDEYYPGAIESVTIDSPPEAYSLGLRWPEPCFPNGVITTYSVLVENRDTGQSVPSRTNDSSVVWTVPTQPYSNYTIRVAAYNVVGRGNYTVGYSMTTDTALPMQPTVVTAKSHRSTEITVTWGPLALYTGPTSYTATAVDSQNSSVIRSCHTGIDFNASACTIAGLEASWNYTVTVTATTNKGNNTSNRVTARTLQAPPGHVTSLSVTPQRDIKSPRTITVAWQPPSKHELNGVIISYTITYKLKDEHNVKYQVVDESVWEYVIVGIPPGQYIIKVYAATKAGNGTEASMETTLPAGALLKPNESVTLLIQPSLGVAHNDETEIAVQLPLVHFLCNSIQGEPVKWGVIVAQEGQANDQSYYGSKVSYEEKTFLSWFDVNGRDPIPPYKATPDTWKPCSPTGGSRRRRAADDTLSFIVGRAGDCAGVARTEYCNGKLPDGRSYSTTLCGGARRRRAADDTLSFIVGRAGDCAGVARTEYCNGKLPDGRSYRAKSFVCTDTGCTETEYSQVFVTAAVTDSVVPIVAGLVSALVVIIAIIVVIVVMRRRQAFCFAKDIENSESSHSRGPPLGTELTEKPTVARSHPVKLIDFPMHVELLQRDSGLLYSEAYKTLREISPKHPIVMAESQSCRTKNRYTNILSFDHSRVKLLPMDDVEGSDYINANYIPGYTSRREYIATQGPITGTVEDFWRMVWEQNVDIIVMLTQCTENGKPKCVQYWPAEVNEPVFYGDLIVSIQSESYLPDYVLRVIEVKLKKHEKRILRQFCFLKWPDMGCTEESKQLLDFAKSVRGHVPLPRRGPMLVHCSAGVGRTGTFICVDHLLQHIRDHDEVEIFNMVLDMRNHRCNMVQTEDQYVFIHRCLRDYITTDDEYDEEDGGEPVYENTELAAENVYENTAFNKD